MAGNMIRKLNIGILNMSAIQLQVVSIGRMTDTGSAPPWSRVLGPEAGGAKGSFGMKGPRTEQFAIGSVIFCLIPGRELFEGEIGDGLTAVQRF